MSLRVIAEAGENHVGDMDRARRMVEIAADAGADFVKFQSYDGDDLAPSVDDETRRWIERVSLDQADHRTLKKVADEAGIRFLSTPVNVRWAEVLRDLGCPTVKIASLSLTNHDLLDFVGDAFEEVFLSTGMGTLDEIQAALDVLGPEPHVTVMHCVSEYPAPDERANLRSITHLDQELGTSVGYSDHTMGTKACLGAIALGAEVVEKHFTLDKTLEGTDHVLSADPEEMAEITHGGRRIRKMLGTADKTPTEPEKGNREDMRTLFREH